MIHFRIRYERLRDRLGSIRKRVAILRSLWIGAIVPLAGLLLYLLDLIPLSPRWFFGAALFVALAAYLLQLRRARSKPIEGELDRRFGLDELLVTAVEVDKRGAKAGLEARLLDDAATAVAQLGDARAIDGSQARREAETLAGLVLFTLGLWLLVGTLRGLPDSGRLPGLPDPAGEVQGPGDGGDFGSAGDTGGSEAAAELASELGDHAAARDIAEALAAGNPAAAARAARALADRAESLSPKGRQALAEAMTAAAERLRPVDAELADALDEAGDALGDGDGGGPSAGIERLAEELDALARNAERRQRSKPEIEVRARLAPPSGRLAESAGTRALPASSPSQSEQRGPGRAQDAGDDDAPLERQAARPAAVDGRVLELAEVDVGPDPMRYPWEMRETVRRYFGSGLDR